MSILVNRMGIRGPGAGLAGGVSAWGSQFCLRHAPCSEVCVVRYSKTLSSFLTGHLGQRHSARPRWAAEVSRR